MGMLEVFIMKFRTITKHNLPILFSKAKLQVEAKQQAEAASNAATDNTTSVSHLTVFRNF